MCRLFGVFSRQLEPAAFYALNAPRSLLFQSDADKKRKQGDGWGVGGFTSQKPIVLKSPRPIYRPDPLLRKKVGQLRSKTLLGHVRWASNPLKLPRKELIGLGHTQPFQHGRYLFIHNGTLYIPREVKAALGPWEKFVKGKNDSEVLFYWILKHLKKHREIQKAVRESLRGLHRVWDSCKHRYPLHKHPYHGLNWVLTDGRVFFALCYVAPGGFGKALALTGKSQPYYQMQVRKTPGGFVLASEPLTPEPGWHGLKHGELISARNDGRSISVKTFQVP